MRTGRLEAFSDGVIAIIITIMVLELRAPHDAGWQALQPLVATFLSYVMSFIYVGIYWNNHHHLLHAAEHVDGRILWANLYLLFWMSLIPFATAWMGETSWEAIPTAVYGFVLLMAALAYPLLEAAIIAQQGPESRLRAALGSGRKEKISVAAYVVAIALAAVTPWASLAIYVGMALLWLVPDRRIASRLAE
jgi:uncharacterized membrane protein